MCGISGIVNKTNQAVNSELIRRMNDAIAHRGPDGEGFFHGENFSLGHKRLSIIDLSNEASQPMSYLNRYQIVFNGEIYNYIELKESLKKEGYSFSTLSDTEVIMAAYDHWGTSCFNHFNGMWSFALFDSLKNILICCRDRFGIKPFYFINNDKFFAFGSEIKQFFNLMPSRKANIQSVMDYLIGGFEDHNNSTFFEEVQKLEQSHYLIYDLKAHTYGVQRYYELQKKQEFEKQTFEDALSYFTDLLNNSISLRLRSDVKVGTCLSGGIDSSAIATYAALQYQKQTTNPFTAITAKSTEKDLDETPWAEKIAKKNKLDWQVVEPDSQDFFSLIDELISLQEEPFGSPSLFMQYKVFEKARKINCPVMLDGQGGDEVFLGYERYYPAFIATLPLFGILPAINQIKKHSKLSFKNVLLYNLYFRNSSIRLRKLRRKYSFIKNEFFDFFDKTIIEKSASSYSDIFEMQKMEVTNLQLPHLLRYEDRNSMRHSIESRLPLLDYRVVEFALSTPAKYKISNGWSKFILRKAMEPLAPDEVTWRKNKIGFQAPEKTWITQHHDYIFNTINQSKLINTICIKENLSSSFANADFNTKWKLFNIARWEELNHVEL